MSYFSGPSTPQMRLTVFLLGVALSGFGYFVGNNNVRASTVAYHGGEVETSCGSPFDQEGSSNFFPDLAQNCTSALTPGRALAIACLVLGGILLVRLLYMLIGPKATSPLS